MESNDGNVFFTSSLLRLHKTGGSVNADNQAAGNLGIEGTAVARLLDTVRKSH